MINEEYVFHLKWVVMLFQNSVVEKRLVDVICGDKTAGKYETEKNIIIVLSYIILGRNKGGLFPKNFRGCLIFAFYFIFMCQFQSFCKFQWVSVGWLDPNTNSRGGGGGLSPLSPFKITYECYAYTIYVLTYT